MLKKTITYTDYNGTKRTEDFWFNLSKFEVMELSSTGNFEDMMKRMINSKDMESLIKVVKELILKSYGKKTADGRFEKTEALRTEFTQTEAFSELFMELAGSDESAIEFIKGIMPADYAAEINKADVKALTDSVN